MAVIRVSGDRGSGKTTACKELKRILGYDYFSVGEIMREMAAKSKMPILEYFAKLEKDPELERSIDAETEKRMMNQDNLIAEGRMAPFLKCRFPYINLFLGIDRKEGAARQLKRKENKGRSFEQVLRGSDERLIIERTRYQSLYGIDNHLDKNKFDINIDTTHINAERVVQEVLRALAHHAAMQCTRKSTWE